MSTPILSRSTRFWLIAVAIAVGSLAVVIMLFSLAKSNTARYTIEDPAGFQTLSETAIVSYGEPSAPHRLIEFASISCPSCAVFHTRWLPELMTQRIETGQLRIDIVGFPLDRAALSAQTLLQCVDNPALRQKTLDFLYNSQTTWLNEQYLAGLTTVFSLAGLGTARIEQCLEDRTINQDILQAATAARDKFSVDRTPSFALNGKKIESFASYADLVDFIIEQTGT